MSFFIYLYSECNENYYLFLKYYFIKFHIAIYLKIFLLCKN